MNITSIYIKNFKAFKEAELYPAGLTLLTGLNGMGKTTIIQSLLLLRQSHEKNTLAKTGLSLNGPLVLIGTGKDAFCWNSEDNHIYFELEWDRQFEASFDFFYSPESDMQALKDFKCSPDFHPFDTSLFNLNFKFLKAQRFFPQIFFPRSVYDVEQRHTLGIIGEYTAHFIAVNQRQHIVIKELKHPSVKNLTLLSQLDAWMSEISPGVSLSATIYNDMNMVKLGYKFETAEGFTEEFNALNVGLGLTYVLPVITAILSSKPGDLLIIENPESHLHPAGQAAIGKLCALAAEAGVQIFLESHSDHILNSIRAAVKKKIISPENVAVYFFERDVNAREHKVAVIQPIIDENGRLDKNPSGFFDEWGKQLDELIK
ncbi:MAG: DUF3696 domain-containing protein [Candidatus Aminicenantes bacterium]|nr:DUF3696 domain-containing protein [Candidatus Aminicenantes bacterium]